VQQIGPTLATRNKTGTVRTFKDYGAIKRRPGAGAFGTFRDIKITLHVIKEGGRTFTICAAIKIQ
jgi:hypothetical protein